MDEGGAQLGSDDIIIPKGIGVGEGGGRLGRLEAILTAIKSSIASMESTPVIPEVTPTLPEAADGTITVAVGNAQDGDEITIGDITYTWKTALSEDSDEAVLYEVLIGENNSASAANLQKAIMAGDTAGTNYSTGTVAHPLVTATVDGAAVTVTAKTKGVVGNAIEWAFTPATEGTSNVTLAPEAALGGGVDGTPAPKGAVTFSGSKIYVSVDESTTAVSHWKSANLTTVSS